MIPHDIMNRCMAKNKQLTAINSLGVKNLFLIWKSRRLLDKITNAETAHEHAADRDKHNHSLFEPISSDSNRWAQF